MEFKAFFKNTSLKHRANNAKEEVNRQKLKRAAVRHELRQSHRNLENGSDEENGEPQQQHQRQLPHQQYQEGRKLSNTGKITNRAPSEDELYRSRLQRLMRYREQKQRLHEEKKSKRKIPFVPYVPKTIVEAIQELQPAKQETRKPLGEMIEQEKKKHINHERKTPVPSKNVKPRVDCWRTKKIVSRAGENVPPRPNPLSEKKVVRSVERPVVKPPKSAHKRPKDALPATNSMKIARPAVVKTQTVRPASQKKPEFAFKVKPPPPAECANGNSGTVGTSVLATSTVRKIRKPLTFSFEMAAQKNMQQKLNVIKAEDLFEGISPIEVETSPIKHPTASGVSQSPVAKKAEIKSGDDSIWDPQPVACLSTYDLTVMNGTASPALVAPEVVATEMEQDAEEGNVSEWLPAQVHEIEIVIDDSDEVFKEAEMVEVSLSAERRRKPALNESFTINVDVEPSDRHEPTEHHLPLEQPIVDAKATEASPKPLAGMMETEPTVQPIQQQNPSSPQGTDELNESKTKKRASLTFTEEPLETEIVPSRSNLSLEEKIKLDAANRSAITDTPSRCSRRRSSVGLPLSVVEPEDGEAAAPPKEVQDKTRSYYDKMEHELSRLQSLCDMYAPFLEATHELNDHCRGLILAAQGQTTILINKKFTKFRELIGHYEKKWNDRKVRHDDLDGFWLMLSLDLENLDKRFDELRVLKENGWQETEVAPPKQEQPKTKKLRAGGGVRKRDKKAAAGGTKATSSVIADLIRKARQEKQKQKTTVEDLEPLKESVAVMTTPAKRSVKFGKSPRRSSGRKRSSLCAGDSPVVFLWDLESKAADVSKRRTIFPDITIKKPEEVKSILKTPKVKNSRSAKSVLFLDSGLDTPPARRRNTYRSVADTPKPRIKFNDELEIEHIDNLAARTPSRLDVEIQKRLQQSLLHDSTVSLRSKTNDDDDDDDSDERLKKQARKVYARGTPRRNDRGSAATGHRRSSRRASCIIAELFDEDSSDTNSWYKDREEETGN
uniref:Guanylate kinase-associated protein mars n=1 Tax=Anopheles epiroticus TaxID=199890 RepID=A0A182P0R6_9DIPT